MKRVFLFTAVLSLFWPVAADARATQCDWYDSQSGCRHQAVTLDGESVYYHRMNCGDGWFNITSGDSYGVCPGWEG